METTQIVQIKITKGDLDFTFHIPASATWGSTIDAANDLLASVCELAKKSMAAQPPVEPEIVEGTQDGN